MVGVDTLGRGVGLADHGGGVGSVGLVHGVADGGRVAELDGLVVGLVGRGHSRQGGQNKHLEKI